MMLTFSNFYSFTSNPAECASKEKVPVKVYKEVGGGRGIKKTVTLSDYVGMSAVS